MDAKPQTHYGGPNNPPAQNYPTPQPAQQYPHPTEPAAGGCLRNLPQFISVGAGACVLFTGGMSMTWGLGIRGGFVFYSSTYLNVCWFVMAIVGAILSAVLTGFLPKKILMFLSSVLVIIGGILFISLYDDFAALMAGLHLNGFAVGWMLVTIFVMAGEEAANEFRGHLISSVEAIFFSLGIFVQMIYSVEYTLSMNYDLYANQFHGTFVLVFGVISLVAALTQVIESPVYYLKKNEEQQALDSVQRLQRPTSTMNGAKHAQLEDYKHYVAESSSGSGTISALLKLGILRGIIGLSFTVIVLGTLDYAAIRTGLYREMRLDEQANLEMQSRFIGDNISHWPYIVFVVCRLAGTFVGTFLQDSLGRKLTLIFGMLVCGGMAIGVGIIFNDIYNIFYTDKMYTVIGLLLAHQFFTGLCITSSSSYLTEAFPATAKPYCIACVLAVEMAMFIICGTITVKITAIANYFLALGSISFVFVVLTILALPETKKTSLHEALLKFQNLLSPSFK